MGVHVSGALFATAVIWDLAPRGAAEPSLACFLQPDVPLEGVVMAQRILVRLCLLPVTPSSAATTTPPEALVNEGFALDARCQVSTADAASLGHLLLQRLLGSVSNPEVGHQRLLHNVLTTPATATAPMVWWQRHAAHALLLALRQSPCAAQSAVKFADHALVLTRCLWQALDVTPATTISSATVAEVAWALVGCIQVADVVLPPFAAVQQVAAPASTTPSVPGSWALPVGVYAQLPLAVRQVSVLSLQEVLTHRVWLRVVSPCGVVQPPALWQSIACLTE